VESNTSTIRAACTTEFKEKIIHTPDKQLKGVITLVEQQAQNIREEFTT
jgi:hypothetical protein